MAEIIKTGRFDLPQTFTFTVRWSELRARNEAAMGLGGIKFTLLSIEEGGLFEVETIVSDAKDLKIMNNRLKEIKKKLN